MKLPFHWTFPVPKHCVKSVQIPILFWTVFFCIRTEYQSYLSKHINIIDGFNQEKEDLSIHTRSFGERKEVSFHIPFCKRNRNEISLTIDKLGHFTDYKVKLTYFRKTRKVRSLFVLNDPLFTKQTLFTRVLDHVMSLM